MIRKECLSTPGLPPSTVPVGQSPMQPFSPAGCVPDRWVSGLFRSSPATIPPPGTTSPSRPPRQTVWAGERGLGVPGPPCKPHGGDGRTARRVCAADVRCAGRLRSADSPALSRGPRPAWDANSGSCVALGRRLTPVAPPATPKFSPRCEQAVCTSRHRGPGRSPRAGCGPVWYVRGDNLQLQTVTDARGAQTPPETVFRARNPGPRAVITALRADTAAGDGVHNLATLAANPKRQR